MNTESKESELIVLPDGSKVAKDRSVGLVLAAFVNYHDNWYVLCNQRGTKTSEAKLKWNLPSGYINWNESGEEGAVRECFEECGVEIPVEMITEIEHSTKPTENRQNIIFRYGTILPAEYYNKVLQADHKESINVKWIPLDSINLYDFAWNQVETISRLFSATIKLAKH